MAKWQPNETYAVRVGGKDGETLTVATADMKDDVLSHVFEYGLRQILNDAGAAAKKPDEKVTLAQKRLQNLIDGNLRAARESDPVRAEARKIATQTVDAKIKAAGKKPEDVANRTDLINQVMAREDVQKAAQAAVDARAGLTVDIDLG
jgi:hypothetical protein